MIYKLQAVTWNREPEDLDRLKEQLSWMTFNVLLRKTQKVRVAIKKGRPKAESLTIVGDWFTAESISASLGKGYQQTIFTRHAPTVQSRIELTDRELGEFLKVRGTKPYSSRRAVISELEKLVKEIDGKDTKK